MLQRACIGLLLTAISVAAFNGWTQSTPRVWSPQHSTTRHTLISRWSTAVTSIFEPPVATDELLDASLAATMAIEEGNISAARTALAELDTKDKLATYTLAIASYFLLSTVTVEELKVLQTYAALLQDMSSDDESTFAKLLSVAHAQAISYYAEARGDRDDYSFDDNLHTSGDLLHTFAVVHLNAPGNFMEDECPEARACDRFLNTYDEEVRVREALRAGRQRYADWVVDRLQDLKESTTSAEFQQARKSLVQEGLELVPFLRLGREDALSTFRYQARLMLGGMVESACSRYESDREKGALGSDPTEGAQGRCLPYVEKLLETASAVVSLLAVLDRLAGDDSLDAYLGSIGTRFGEDEEDLEMEEAAAVEEEEEVEELPDDAPLKAPKVLADKHLTTLALSKLERRAVYSVYLRHFCCEVLRGRVDISSEDHNSRRHEPSLLEALTSANPYDARDINAAAYRYAVAKVLEERLADALATDGGGDNSDSLVRRATALASLLNLPKDAQPTAAEAALAVAAKTRGGDAEANTALSKASMLLGLDSAALESAVAAAAQAQAVASLGTRLATFATTAASTSYAMPQSALETLRAAAVAASVVADRDTEAVAALGTSTLEAALAAEKAGDLATAKGRFRSAAALPLLLDGGSGDAEANGSAPAVRALRAAVREQLSEEAEEAISELCWELEDSGEPENEAIAKGVLTLLGMR